VVRQGIAVLIGSQSDKALVAEASNGHEAIQQFRKHRPKYDHQVGLPIF
jgi:YesN/AraC family two-component response regulator